jgi:hypothetical protein
MLCASAELMVVLIKYHFSRLRRRIDFAASSNTTPCGDILYVVKCLQSLIGTVVLNDVAGD